MSGLLKDEGHLHQPYSEERRAQLDLTLPGQAHFAVPGSPNTCRECESWGGGRLRRDKTGALLHQRCRKARALMHGAPPAFIPHTAIACMFFKMRRNVPPVIRRKEPKP